MKLTVKDLLANYSKIGSAYGELAWLSEADSPQIRVSEIAEGLGKTPRSVRQNLQYLEDERVIRIERTPRKPNVYTILIGENGDAS